MQIRKTETNELNTVMRIYRDAREFMLATGNTTQWFYGEPSEEIIRDDIEKGDSYVVTENGRILAVFMYRKGIDPTYIEIEVGKWLNDEPYGVIHRIAVAERGRGVAAFVFDIVFGWCGNLRIDTHENNKPMQRALEKSGFKYCGIIHIASGAPRLAYHKIKCP